MTQADRKKKSQSIPNRSGTYGDMSRNARIGDDENSPNFHEYVMTKQRGWRNGELSLKFGECSYMVAMGTLSVWQF